jgi:hypothetical protein
MGIAIPLLAHIPNRMMGRKALSQMTVSPVLMYPVLIPVLMVMILPMMTCVV